LLKEIKIFIDNKVYYINKISLRGLRPQNHKLKILGVDTFLNTNEKIFNLIITNEENSLRGYLYEEK